MSSETVDPLALLRDFLRTPQSCVISVDNEKRELHFEGTSLRLPFDTPTAWKRSDNKGHYTLGSLWLSIGQRETKLSEYAKECIKLKLAQVTFGDRKSVLDYFTVSRQESDPKIDSTIWAQTLLRKSDIRAGRVIKKAERKRDEKSHRKSGEE